MGVLQFDVAAYRLKDEYGVEATFEPVSVTTARWVHCSNEKKLEEFREKNALNLARMRPGTWSTWRRPGSTCSWRRNARRTCASRPPAKRRIPFRWADATEADPRSVDPRHAWIGAIHPHTVTGVHMAAIAAMIGDAGPLPANNAHAHVHDVYCFDP